MIYSKTNIKEVARLTAEAGSAPARPVNKEDRCNAGRLLALSESNDAAMFHHRVENALTGLALVHLLPWDTGFFGFPCARINTLMVKGSNTDRFDIALDLLDRVLDWSVSRHVCFLSIKIPGPDPLVCQALQARNFYLVDTGVRLTRHAQHIDFQALPDGWSYRDQVACPAAVASVFKSLFYDGRFHNDPRVPLDQADRLWESAIRNQLSGEAGHVLLLLENNQPRGLTTLRTIPAGETCQKPVGSLSIVGLLEQCRGQGLGRRLLAETLLRYQYNYRFIVIETSTYNEPALRLYRSQGFESGLFTAGFHRWLP
jgi:ribosomal protein S18 acetylase RimI-like enzyme